VCVCEVEKVRGSLKGSTCVRVKIEKDFLPKRVVSSFGVVL